MPIFQIEVLNSISLKFPNITNQKEKVNEMNLILENKKKDGWLKILNFNYLSF